jgi:hypothetical protein
MDRDIDFDSMARIAGEHGEGVQRATADSQSSEMLIASAEYELAELKKAFADNRLEPEPVPEKRRGQTPAQFAGKLRKPETLEKPKWRAALGLAS